MAGIFNKSIFNKAIFNTDGAAAIASSGNGSFYRFDKIDYDRKEAIKQQKLLAEFRLAKDKEIRAMEARRKDRLDDLALQTRLIGLMQDSEKMRLENERLQGIINFRINDEEDVMILLACLPFH